MEVNTLQVPVNMGKPIHLSVYSDIHDRWDAVRSHMEARAKLPNARFILLGDHGDFITPDDRRRFQPSRVPEELRGADDFLDRMIDKQAKEWGHFPWVLIGAGNHDNDVLKTHYTNPTARLAHRLGAVYGGFSGFLRLQFKSKGTGQTIGKFTLLYHHGGSAGAVTKGLPWAQRYAAGWEGWDVFCFGHTHNHYCFHSKAGRMHERGALDWRQRYIVNCGTWLETYNEGGSPGYGEIKGYPPVSLAAPLIQITVNRGAKVDVVVHVGGGA